MKQTASVMEIMANRYNQLYLTPKRGISETQMYYDIVDCGKIPPELEEKMESGLTGFNCNDKDRLFTETTPAGTVDVIYLYDRSDFERFIQIMAYNCEPAKVSEKLDCAEISGITNWRKIENYMNRYFTSGGAADAWKEELDKFTEDKNNFQDSIIVIGNREYSGLNAEDAGFNQDIWSDISLKIKIYSSCAHFICRRLFSECKNRIWEEIVSDCIGILFAFNKYDAELAKKLFGVSKKGYVKHGKYAETYLDPDRNPDELAIKISQTIDKLSQQIRNNILSGITDYYNILIVIEKQMNEYISILK